MYTARIETAEEIQLLLPDNQPAPGLEVNAVTMLGLGLLLVAIPAACFRLMKARTSAA